jgi:hypothetical protein
VCVEKALLVQCVFRTNQGETGSWISHLFQENTPRALSLNLQVNAKCRVKWFYRRPLARCREWKKFRNREHVQTAYYQSGERFVFATRLPPFWEMECVEKTFLNRSNSTRPKKQKAAQVREIYYRLTTENRVFNTHSWDRSGPIGLGVFRSSSRMVIPMLIDREPQEFTLHPTKGKIAFSST